MTNHKAAMSESHKLTSPVYEAEAGIKIVHVVCIESALKGNKGYIVWEGNSVNA